MRRLAVLLGLVALLAPAAARADADPASDYLYTQWVFLPYETRVPAADATRLRAVVAEARKSSYPIKVAIIGSKYDLGGIAALWKQPKQYARFLGAELSFLYKGRLLVVMPNGLGFSRNGQPLPAEEAFLRGVRVGPGGHGLAVAATTAVERLAARSGHPLEVPAAGDSSSSGDGTASRDRVIIAAVLLALALGWAAVLLRRRRAA
jgi:hypothetical protein